MSDTPENNSNVLPYSRRVMSSTFHLLTFALFTITITAIAVWLFCSVTATQKLPFTLGQMIWNEWKVLEVYTDKDEMLLSLARGTQPDIKQINITVKSEQEPYQINIHALETTPAALLETVRQQIKVWEADQGKQLFTSEKAIATDSFLMFIIPMLLIFLFIGSSLIVWSRDNPRFKTSAFIVAVAALLILLFFKLCPNLITVIPEFVTVLTQAWSKTTVDLIHANGIHAGFAFKPILLGFDFHQPTLLQQMVKANIFLGIMNALYIFCIALHILKRPFLAIALALLASINILTLNAMFSEIPSTLLAFLFWNGILAMYWIYDDKKHPCLSMFSIIILTLVTWLTLAIRPEVGSFGLIAIALVILKPVAPILNKLKSRLARDRNSLHDKQKTIGRDGVLWTITIVFALICFFLVRLKNHDDIINPIIIFPNFFSGYKEQLHMVHQWAIDSFNPTNFSFLLLPGLMSQYFSTSIVLLIGLGIFHTLRQLAIRNVLPIVLIFTFNIYIVVAGGDIRYHFRLISMLVAPLFLLVIWGMKVIITHSHFTALSRSAQRWMIIAILFLCADSSSYFIQDNTPSDPLEGTGAHKLALLDRNEQQEARFLLRTMMDYPNCLFVTKTMVNKHSLSINKQFEYTIWGHDKKQVTRSANLPNKDELNTSCLLFINSLDCFRSGANGCIEETAGLKPLSELRFISKAYAPEIEWGPTAEDIHLAVYRL